MYSWMWRALPGPTAAKVVECMVIFLLVVALLFFVIFPWVEPRLPFNNVTVGN